FDSPLRQVDLNGDGLRDLYGAKGEDDVLWVNLGNGAFEPQLIPRTQPPLEGFSRGPLQTVVDYTGDGRGSILEAWELPGTVFSEGYENLIVLGNPGLSKLTAFSEQTIKQTLLTQNGFDPSVQQLSVGGDHWAGVADLDGDGAGDVLRGNLLEGAFYGRSKLNGLLSRVTDGLGNYISVEYDSAKHPEGDPGEYSL